MNGQPVSGGSRGRASFLVGDFRVHPASGEIARGAERVRLQPKVMQVLVALGEARGDVVTKEDLLARVWPGVNVTDDVLRRCIHALRTALGDDASAPRYVETLPRRGYRLVAPVRPVEDGSVLSPSIGEPEPASVGGAMAREAVAARRTGGPRLRQVSAAAVFVVMALAALWAAGAGGRSIATRFRPGAMAPGGGVTVESETPERYLELAARFTEAHDRAGMDKAVALLERAVALEPGSAAAHASLANAYALEATQFFGNQTLLESALDEARRALDLDGAQAEAYKAMGLVYVARGAPYRALDAYRRAVELRPGYMAAINNLALVYLSLGDLRESLFWQKQLQGTAWKSRAHLNNLGYTYLLLGDLRSARETLDRVLDIEPYQPHATANLAYVSLLEGDVDDAHRRVEDALAVQPTAVPCLNAAGLVASINGDLTAAQGRFERSLELSSDGTNVRAWLGLAAVQQRLGNEARANELLDGVAAWARQLLAAGNEHWQPRQDLAAVAAMRGRADDAFAWLQRAVEHGFTAAWELRLDPAYAGLRNDPRFDGLLERLARRVGDMGTGI